MTSSSFSSNSFGRWTVARQRTAWLSTLFAACAVLAGCGSKSDTTTQAVPVQLVTAQSGGNQTEMSLSGTVVSRVESQLAFRVSGRIVERPADTGAVVSSGAPLARLDDTPFKLAVEEASANLAQAQATLARVRRDVERNRALAQSGAVAGSEFDALENQYLNAQAQVRASQSRLDRAREDLSYTTLTAPSAGTVALVQAEVGQVVAAGTPVVRVAQSGETEVQVDVPESQIGSMKAGQSAQISLLSLPNAELTGTLREIATVADPATRTYRVRVRLAEMPAEARLGMTASVHIGVEREGKRFQLPAGALFQQGTQPAVWVLPDGAQHLVLRPVSLEAMGTDTITVAKGVKAGERVVAAGVHRLDAKMAVKAWDGRLP